MEKFCKDLKKHAIEIINYIKNMKPLTSKENKSRLKKTNCHIYQEEIRATLFMVKLKNIVIIQTNIKALDSQSRGPGF